LHPKQES